MISAGRPSQAAHSIRGVSRLAFLSVLAVVTAVFLEHMVRALPLVPLALRDDHRMVAWPVMLKVTLLVAAADALFLLAVAIAPDNAPGDRMPDGAPERPAWLPRRLRATAAQVRLPVLLAVAVTSVVLGVLASRYFQSWEVGIFVLAPWLPLLSAAFGWLWRYYGSAYTLFALIALLQLGHLNEHIFQNIQLLVTGNPVISKGVLGQLDIEAVHLTWNVAIWIGTGYLLIIYGHRSPWLWVSFIAASLHSIEHLYIGWFYFRNYDLYRAGGTAGIMAAGGLVGSPLARPYLHLVYNLIEVVPFLFAFWDESKGAQAIARARAAVKGSASRLARLRSLRTAGIAATVAILGSVIMPVTAAATQLTQQSPMGVSCVNVAAASGLNFDAGYGIDPDPDGLNRMMRDNMGNGAAVGDYLGDGYLDVYLLGQAGHPSRLFRNVPAPGGGRRFVDVTGEAGLSDQMGMSRVAFFADLTGNGRQDLVVINDRDPAGLLPGSRIYRNNGDGTFTDVTAGSGFDPAGYIVGGAALIDYTGSGLPGLYISYWTKYGMGMPPFSPRQFPGYNRLFANLGGYHFKDVTEEAGLGQLAIDSFTPIAMDFTGSGRPDIFVPTDFGEGDRFYRNVGGRFVDQSSALGGHRGNDMGVAVGGTGNGLDLYVTSIVHPAKSVPWKSGNALLMPVMAGGKLAAMQDQAAARGVVDGAWGWGTAFVDVRRNGNLDIYTVQGSQQMGQMEPTTLDRRAHLFLSDGDGGYKPSRNTGCEALGDQRSLVVFDYNRNGAPDFLVTQVNAAPLLLENRSAGGHGLTVQCEGRGSRCLGAQVSVTSGGHREDQVLLGGASYLAGPPMEAYFGLGAATAADQVQVRWPGGTVQTLTAVPGDQLLVVHAPPVSERDRLGS